MARGGEHSFQTSQADQAMKTEIKLQLGWANNCKGSHQQPGVAVHPTIPARGKRLSLIHI